MTSVGADTFQIPALDGGGIKGLFSAAVLARIEEDSGIRIADHFDLVTGTSTGGIIALGLGAGLRSFATIGSDLRRERESGDLRMAAGTGILSSTGSTVVRNHTFYGETE